MILRTLTATALLALLVNAGPVFSSDLNEDAKGDGKPATTPATSDADTSKDSATEDQKGPDAKKMKLCNLL